MRPITDFLVEFSRADVPPGLLIEPDDLDFPEVEIEAAVTPVDPELLAAERAMGYAAGLAEGRAQAEEAAAARIAALREEAAAERAAERAGWAAEEGTALAEGLRAGFERLEQTIALSLAAALLPGLVGAIRERAAAELTTAVGQLLTGGQGSVIEVFGPADLLAPTRDAFADNPAVLCHEADGPEVSIKAGDTTVVSQVESWSARLAELFGEAV